MHKAKLTQILNSYDTMICVAGGFTMGSIKDTDEFEKYEKMDQEDELPEYPTNSSFGY